jgi:hypothetical protein
VGHRLAHRMRHDPHGQGGVRLGRDRLALGSDLRELLAHGVGADPESFQRLGRHALATEGQQELLGAGMVQATAGGLLPGQDDDLAGVVGEGDEPGDRGLDAGPGPGVQSPEPPAGQQRSHGCLPGGRG